MARSSLTKRYSSRQAPFSPAAAERGVGTGQEDMPPDVALQAAEVYNHASTCVIRLRASVRSTDRGRADGNLSHAGHASTQVAAGDDGDMLRPGDPVT